MDRTGQFAELRLSSCYGRYMHSPCLGSDPVDEILSTSFGSLVGLSRGLFMSAPPVLLLPRDCNRGWSIIPRLETGV